MSNRSALINLSLIISLLVSFSSYSVETNSDKFKSFNVDSKERQQFVLSQHSKVNNRLKTSSNFKKIQETVKTYGSEFVLGSATGNNGKEYELYDRGLGKPNELVEKSSDGSSKVVFSSLLLSRSNKYNALSLTLSPLKKKAVILFSYKGSIDGFKIVTIDLETDKVVFLSSDFTYYGEVGTGIFFKDENTIITESSDESHRGLVTMSIVDNSVPELLLKDVWINELLGDGLHAASENDENYLVTSDKIINLGKYKNLKILNQDKEFIYFESSSTNSNKTLSSYYKYQLETKEAKKLFETEFVSSFAFFSQKIFMIGSSSGFKQFLHAYSQDGNKISTIEIPFCCQVKGYTIEPSTDPSKVKSVNLTLTSPIVSSKSYTWNLEKESSVVPADFAKSMLESEDFSIVVEERFAKSFDGTMIPFRVVYKTDLELINRPVYMETYGGFNSSGYLENRLNVFNKDFIKHGGVYVGPGVRGGNEYGDSWHESAVKEKKTKTFEDLASVAKSLIESSVTTKDKIVIAGSSNGGLTVAATALLFPQYFGMAIPHNGVLDMLDKEELDPRFDFGWSYEYGDSRIEDNFSYLKKYSPLELISEVKNPPHLLILNGRTDTRVNPAHSIKLAAAAKSAGLENVDLVSINNSGHFNASMAMSDFIGWRLMSIKWTTIYDFLGMEY